MAGKEQIFLQLTAEFGSTKFGPFTGAEIRLGSAPAPQNDITLPAGLGVVAEHVKIVPQQQDSFIIAPIERGAEIYVWRGEADARLITSPVALSVGDSFALVSAQGPRFILLVESVGPKKGGAKRGPRAVTAGGLFAEIKRRGLTTVLASGIGNQLHSAYYFVTSGAIFRPRYIITGLMMAAGWLAAASAGLAAFSVNLDMTEKDEKIEDLQADMVGCGGDLMEDPTFAELTQQLLKDTEWQDTLERNANVTLAYSAKFKYIMANREKYAQIYGASGQPSVARFSKALTGQGMDAGLVRVLSYAAAFSTTTREWSLVRQDSMAERACGRGPLQMTYRQANNLGLSNLSLDALVDNSTATNSEIEPKRQALINTSRMSGVENPEFEDAMVMSEGVEQGKYQCLYLDGDDDRSEIKATAKALNKVLGDKAKGLPAVGLDFWIAARLLKLYAADFDLGYDDVTFDANTPPESVLGEIVADNQKAFAIKNAGDVIAKAVAIPCLAALDKDLKKPPEFLGELPGKFPCLYLDYMAEYEL